jgi:restriction system protein
MGRSSFASLLNAMAREAARRQRLAEAEHRRQLRASIQAERDEERQRALEAKEAKQQHIEERIAEAQDKTIEVQDRINELKQILQHTLSVDDTITFDSLRIKEKIPPFSPKPELANPSPLPSKDEFLQDIKPPSGLQKLIPGSQDRYRTALGQAESKYRAAFRTYQEQEAKRLNNLEEAKRKYEESKKEHEAKVQRRNEEVDEFEACYKKGDPKAVVGYNTMVLERSDYPEGFPQEFRVAYVPESLQLVIDYELPTPEVIPKVVEFKYVKTKDVIEEKPRKEAEIKELYQDVVAAIALRTSHEIFEADQGSHIDVVAFNGFVQTIDVSTGKDIRPYLISLRVTKERFKELDLGRIDKKACLRNLGAQVSPRPYEVQPVKPIVEFDMVDKRFVEQSDILSDLESRPNLMDLNPFEFENLVGNLFKQLGLETKLTRSSKDGGVDVVAFDVRPVIGGKVVIQANRYKNTVGVSAVRDLYGTMMNEGANKGILVTTSGYGSDAFEFAKDKPIELLDGGQLLYLLEQVGVKSRIVFPDDGKA